MTTKGKLGIIILAAGSSSRLGQPKQLLSYQHKSLLQHTIDAAKNIRDAIVVLILGGNYAAIAEQTGLSGLNVMYNADWEEGMSSSIRAGLSALLRESADQNPKFDGAVSPEGSLSNDHTLMNSKGQPEVSARYMGSDAKNTDLEGVILTVCDQPFLSSAVLQALLDEVHESGKSIVASAYNGTFGTPVYFGRQYFQDLLALKGRQGAKMLLKKYEAQVASLPFEKGEIDIDTLEDYQKLISP